MRIKFLRWATQSKKKNKKKTKADSGYNAKISDTEKKYFSAVDYIKFTNEILGAKKKIVSKSVICNLVKIFDLNTKLAGQFDPALHISRRTNLTSI